MASAEDVSLTFFTKATPSQWAFVLSKYGEVFKKHAEITRGARKNGPAELIKLDNWYQNQLPSLIRSRKEHQLVYEDLVQLAKWKLLRGKFRPSLLDLVKTNTETAVKNVTKKAFKKMPNIASAISALTTLKGIGPATASGILVAYMPDVCPYMADENMLATPGVEATDYTSTEYLNYVEQLNKAVVKLRSEDSAGNWTPHKVELALWTHYQIKQYDLNSLLDDMPLSESSSQETNETENDSEESSTNVLESTKVESEQKKEIPKEVITKITPIMVEEESNMEVPACESAKFLQQQPEAALNGVNSGCSSNTSAFSDTGSKDGLASSEENSNLSTSNLCYERLPAEEGPALKRIKVE